MTSKAQAYRKRIQVLKVALLSYLGINGRYYGELNRMEQSVEDLAQALNTRLDQLLLGVENGLPDEGSQSPRDRLSQRLMETATRLTRGGHVDDEMADQFEQSLDLFDIAADLKRQAETTKDAAESAAIKHKRKK